MTGDEDYVPDSDEEVTSFPISINPQVASLLQDMVLRIERKESVQQSNTAAALPQQQQRSTQGQWDDDVQLGIQNTAEAFSRNDAVPLAQQAKRGSEPITDDVRQNDETDVLAVGDTVIVAARVWPGVNKLGGAARVTKVYIEKDSDAGQDIVYYGVQYLLGGGEKKVEAEYVEGVDLMKSTGPGRKKKARKFYHGKQR